MTAGTKAFHWPSAHELTTRAMVAERDEYERELDVGREPETNDDEGTDS